MENIIQILIEGTILWMPKLGSAVFILIIFIIISKIIRRVIYKGTERLKLDINLTSLLARTGSLTVMILGFITALGTIGINVSALVAGLGLTGFALGFALKDAISNLLSGVLILLYKPFKIGNSIKIAGYDGNVVSIDLRYTELNSDGNKVLIPNSKLFTDPITIYQQENCKKETVKEKSL